MTEAYICDYIRTPIGRYAGALSAVRADDLAAVPLRALMARNPGVDWEAVDDVYYWAANQAGEDASKWPLVYLPATVGAAICILLLWLAARPRGPRRDAEASR